MDTERKKIVEWFTRLGSNLSRITSGIPLVLLLKQGSQSDYMMLGIGYFPKDEQERLQERILNLYYPPQHFVLLPQNQTRLEALSRPLIISKLVDLLQVIDDTDFVSSRTFLGKSRSKDNPLTLYFHFAEDNGWYTPPDSRNKLYGKDRPEDAFIVLRDEVPSVGVIIDLIKYTTPTVNEVGIYVGTGEHKESVFVKAGEESFLHKPNSEKSPPSLVKIDTKLTFVGSGVYFMIGGQEYPTSIGFHEGDDKSNAYMKATVKGLEDDSCNYSEIERIVKGGVEMTLTYLKNL